MRLTLTHITLGNVDYETITVQGDDYQQLRDEAMAQVPDGRIAASLRVER